MSHKIILSVVFILWPFAPRHIYGQVNVGLSSTFQYLKGSDASNLADNWYEEDFDGSGWGMSATPFHYGDGVGGTALTDMQGNYSTVYLRKTFTALNIHQIKELVLGVNYDDGFILWINGQPALKRNAPDMPSSNALAPADHESGTLEFYTIDSSEIQLKEGDNTLAVQCFNVLINSSDFFFDLSLSASLSLPEFPDSVNVLFSDEAGFYNGPFDLQVQAPDGEYKIVYTTDCSDPRNLPVSDASDSPVNLKIAPNDTLRDENTPVYTVRASLVKEGYAPSKPVTRSFIFLDEVAKQTYPGGDWLDKPVNGQVIDLDVAADVVGDPRYSGYFGEALTQVPSIVVTTDLQNLFGSSSGIYVNAMEHGKEWERECAIEFIYPDSLSSLSINAGLRIRGGNSRNSENPKHAFRLFFREEYGSAKLNHFVFGNTGAGEFDKLDLRTAQNYSWSMDGSPHNTFLRDIFSRDLQRDMAEPYTRGNYCHLYLNGMYWGLFQTEERPEARYAESYFGDNKDDYDVIKVAVDNWPYVNEATDGNMGAWKELWELCEKGFKSNSDYFALEGKDKNGMPMKNSRVLVDIDNLIDYMLVIFYTANVDAPVSAWYYNAMPNNYYAVYNRKDKGKGFVFIAHDSEHCMFADPIYVHDGLYENRVIIDDPEMVVTGVETFQPQWLHQKLMQNEEYRVRFIDRALMQINGPLSITSSRERLETRAGQINMAIIAESARWGDAKTSPSRNKVDDWLPEVESMVQEFVPYRTDILIDQLKDAGLYPELDPPLTYLDGTEIKEGYFQISTNKQLKLRNPNNTGTIYYTLDGTDPRLVGGRAGSTAISGDGDINLTINASSVIEARVYNEGKWSARVGVKLAIDEEDYSNLKITELHYHPKDVVVGTDTIGGTDLEFLELKNVGKYALDISGVRIDSAINFQVLDKSMLPPGGFYVIASKPEWFYVQYGIYPNGNYSGHFSNSGEKIVVITPQDKLLYEFVYDDKSPWPESADGEGNSLVPRLASAVGDPADPLYWRSSYNYGGSPFADDVLTLQEEHYFPEFSWEDIIVYPNPTTNYVYVDIPPGDVPRQIQMEITDIMGRVISKTDLGPTTKVSLKDYGLTPGVYFLSLTMLKNKKTFNIMFQP